MWTKKFVPHSFLAVAIPDFLIGFVLFVPRCLQPEDLTSLFCADILTLSIICFLVTLMFLPSIRTGKYHGTVSECVPEPWCRTRRVTRPDYDRLGSHNLCRVRKTTWSQFKRRSHPEVHRTHTKAMSRVPKTQHKADHVAAAQKKAIEA